MAEKKGRQRDSNQVTIGAGTHVDQVAAGSNNFLLKIHAEQYIENLVEARRENSLRFSIPAPSPVFVGRKRDVRKVIRQIEKGKGAAISGVAGMGGVGKTELAHYVAHQLKDKYPFGCEIDLRGTTDMYCTPKTGHKNHVFN